MIRILASLVLIFFLGLTGAALLIGDSGFTTWQIISMAIVFFFVAGGIVGFVNPKHHWMSILVPWFMTFAFIRLLFVLPDTELGTLLQGFGFILGPSSISYLGSMLGAQIKKRSA